MKLMKCSGLIKLILGVLSIFFLSFSCSNGLGQEASTDQNVRLTDAKQAYNALDAQKAFQLFSAVWENESIPEIDRLEAARYMIKLKFRQQNEPEEALEILNQLTERKQGISLAYTLKARILSGLEQYEEALYWAEKAISSKVSDLQLLKAVDIYGHSILSLAREEILTDQKITDKTQREMLKVHSQLSNWLNERRDNTDMAGFYLGTSLTLGKGPEALKAWRLFFRINANEEVHPSLLKEYDQFEEALLKWNDNEVSKDEILTIINGLSSSGFVEYAWTLAVSKLDKDALETTVLSELGAYYSYLNRMDDVIQDYYRRLVKGKAKDQELRDSFAEESRQLWKKFTWPDFKPSYSQKAFINEVKQRFKGHISFNSASGNLSIHFGQIVLDDKRRISQHGQVAEFRYILLDHMVSNGYSTWFSDGARSVGGWATSEGYFAQVREDLNREIAGVWSVLNDPEERQKMEDQIARMSANQEDLLRDEPVRYLPGLQLRILINESQKIVDSLKQTGLSNSELRYAFITYMERISQDAKIYAHEGRHSIDMKYGFVKGSANLEFTAKLSEIYFSEKPLFFLATLFGSDMATGTAHGQANHRIFVELVKWMEANQSEIKGFDISKPTLLQFAKLSDKQIREAIKSFDPMAK